MLSQDKWWLGLAGVLCFLAGQVHAEEKVDFNRDIRAILTKNCLACHGPDETHRKAGLRLDQRDSAIGKLESGLQAIVPGKIDESELVARITSQVPEEVMPPAGSGFTLTPKQIETLKKWVAQGAQYEQHWSFVKPLKHELPSVSHKNWPRNGLDYFVLAELEKHGLKPSPEADPHTLIRRLSLDLRGIPPTPAEVDEFINDKAPDAYERLVDRMLKDPAYGERWARMWLDLARYADSKGLGSDPLRTIWRYRDWVIDAYNRNLPYDQFTTEQLAGDLLPNATLEQRLATAFHRNTISNDEGGTDDEEYRVVAVKDRIDTTMQVWMGLTFGCAKCHNHKYEPITQKEYYSFYAIFNQTADADRGDESPLLSVPTPAMQEEDARVSAKIADLKKQLDTGTPELAAKQAEWEGQFRVQPEWKSLALKEAKSAGGATLTIDPSGVVTASGTNPPQDTYTVSGETDLAGVTALRLETIPDPALPGGGAGRNVDGNFVLSRISVTAADAARVGQPVSGRYVRVDYPGAGKMLSLAEVQVLSGGTNVALKGQAKQSSTDYEGAAQRAIDGETNGNYFEKNSVTHTKQEDNPWWEVELPQATAIDSLHLWNRTDGGTGSRLSNFKVSILDADRKTVWQQDIKESPNPSVALSPTGILNVNLAAAGADFSQDQFPATAALTGKDLAKTGWAVGPKIKEPHQATFVFAEGVGAAGQKTLLTVTLQHQFNMPQYSLGKFRLSVSTSLEVRKRLTVPAEILAIIDLPADKRSPEQIASLGVYYRGQAPELKPLRDQIAQLEANRPKFPTVPVLEELPANQQRKTFVMTKGNYLAPGVEVSPQLPQVFHVLPQGVTLNRLGVAQWLMSRDNPLTARVAVNRYWAQLFGIGLVETEEDFGSQGDLPSHPQLLDWLAVEYMDLKWDTKALLKTIVTSATYRQSSRVTPELLAKDPRNRLLSRGPRFRLEAEIVRDQALVLSGLLSRKSHGPSVFPPQPDGLWQAAFNGQRTWTTSMGEDKHRRALYTFWRRTVPYPSMATFDAPSREICAIRRIRTNTPLQAFVTLNDPAYVEAAQALARRIMKEGGSTPDSRAAYGLRLCLVRPPSAEQISEIVNLYQDELTYYSQHVPEATKLASEPMGPIPEGMQAPELAAWTVVSNVLLNLDGVLTKN